MNTAAHIAALLLVGAASQWQGEMLGAPELPPPELSADGRRALLANGTAPISIGLYAMIFVEYPKTHSQFPPMTPADFRGLVRGPATGVSMHFSWADIQPRAPSPGDSGFSSSLLDAFLDSIDAACVAEGLPKACLPVFLKPFLAREPDWSYRGPPATTNRPTIAMNELGMRVVVQPREWIPFPNDVVPNSTIPISTDPAWQRQVNAATAFVADWLERADPNATRVTMVHFFPPVMTSLQMRPGPQQLFEYMANNGTDTIGMDWSKAAHIDAWRKHARNMSYYPAFSKRVWAFDFTNLPKHAPKNGSGPVPLYLDTSDQKLVFDELVAAHPRGPGAVVAKTESLHVDLGTPPNASRCDFVPDPVHSPRSFARQYAQAADIPYALIGSRKWRHGWENFAPLEMPALPHNTTQIPGMYPVPVLANNSLYLDMIAKPYPLNPQGTLWSEIWRFEAINTSAAPACVSPSVLERQIRDWDSSMRQVYAQSLPGALKEE